MNAAQACGDNIFTSDSLALAHLYWPLYQGYIDDGPTYRAFGFRTYVAPGLADPDRQVLKIDYDLPGNPRLSIRRILDELMQVAVRTALEPRLRQTIAAPGYRRAEEWITRPSVDCLPAHRLVHARCRLEILDRQDQLVDPFGVVRSRCRGGWRRCIRRFGWRGGQRAESAQRDHTECRRRDPDGREVLSGLQVSASTGTLSRLCGAPGFRFHCYAGYAGWGPGQLEQEIAEGSWILAPAEPRFVFDTPIDEVWDRALKENGIDPSMLVPGGGEN